MSFGRRLVTRYCAPLAVLRGPASVCQNHHGEADPSEGIRRGQYEVEHYNSVDVAEVPSAAWGWSRINRRAWYVTGAISVIFLLAMLRGNHVGHVEDVYLFVFAAVASSCSSATMGPPTGWLGSGHRPPGAPALANAAITSTTAPPATVRRHVGAPNRPARPAGGRPT